MAKIIGFKTVEAPEIEKAHGVVKSPAINPQTIQYVLGVMYAVAVILVLCTWFEITCFYSGVGLWLLTELLGDFMESQSTSTLHGLEEE